MNPEENKKTLLWYLDETWNKNNWAAAEQVVDENVIFHDHVRNGLPQGRESLRMSIQSIRAAIPDMTMEIDDVIAFEDRVVIRYRAMGTQSGPLMGYPGTNRHAVYNAISIVRFADGKIVEGWQEADELSMARQIGMIPGGTMPKPMLVLLSIWARLKDRINRRSKATPLAVS
jgi:steroid delta-isomerase-like uncharacterized protein